MTFFNFLTYWGGVEGVAAEATPATGTHLSTLAIELPHFVTPAIAGLTVGSVVGVVGFVAVLLLVGRGSRRTSRRRSYGPSTPMFRPSTALSARAFAKMGYGADTDEPSGPVLAQVPAVTISPVIVLSASPAGEKAKEKSSPHPLGIIQSTSSAMRMGAAPIDLSFDDSPTEIGETYFDEPPEPRRRTDPPRIRKIVPAAPRFGEQTRGG